MGSDQGEPDERPQHPVTLSPFLIDKYEVTQQMLASVQLPNPSRWQTDPQLPVERIRWREARIYCNERSLLEGLTPCYDESKAGMPCDYSANGYRLPTEAEWEYACRCGSEDEFDFGSISELDQYAYYRDNSQEQTHVVGSRRPNGWGLHDMYGNVSEWCEDVYAADYYATSPEHDPTGPVTEASDAKRVLRGGSWKASAKMCRATYREGQRTGDSDACFYMDYCGFRCVRRITAEELAALQAGPQDATGSEASKSAAASE